MCIHICRQYFVYARICSCDGSLCLFSGLLRDAEKQLRSSLNHQPIVNTYLELCNVYLRLDLPNTAIDLLTEARLAQSVFLSSTMLKVALLDVMALVQ